MNTEYYKNLRNKYTPKLVFLLESPPISGKYFYDDAGSINEPLFKAMIELICLDVKSKRDGLEKFKEKGYLMVDSTYTPVNNLPSSERDKIIESNFDNLLVDLEQLNCKNVILVKKNVCKLLAKKLSDRGFNVLNFRDNKLIEIPFPAFGWQREFFKKVKDLIQ